ncbi:MAG: catalytic domain [Patescibacteria group bacterium]|nr:catalytic domain [Patescibacteria group bacterium]
MAPSSIGELACLRQGHQVFQPEADHPLGGILVKDMFYVYILKSTVKDVYYIGSTEDLRKRLLNTIRGRQNQISCTA